MRVLVAAFAVLVGAWRAQAQPRREAILVVAGDPGFRAALGEVLAPVGMAPVALDTPAPTLANITRTSHDLTDREHATAAVWLVAADGHTTLVTYDRGVDRVLVRTLPFATPFGAAQSAEAARMASTMLRALRVTPDVNVPPPRAADAPAIRAAAAAAEVRGHIPARLAVALGAGARDNSTTTSASFAGEGAIVWRPDSLGIALVGSYAPSTEVERAVFVGTASDESLAALARWSLRSGPSPLRITAVAGPALHVVTLRGTPNSGSAVGVTRYDPAARVGGIIGVALDPSVDVGLAVTLDYLLERQRFEVQGVEFLSTPRLELSTTLVLTLRVL